MIPSFTSRPARRAVCSIHRETMCIDAFCTASDISVGISTGRGRGCDNAWRGKAKRKYWPLAFEYSARKIGKRKVNIDFVYISACVQKPNLLQSTIFFTNGGKY